MEDIVRFILRIVLSCVVFRSLCVLCNDQIAVNHINTNITALSIENPDLVDRFNFIEWVQQLINKPPAGIGVKPPSQPATNEEIVEPSKCAPCKCGITNKLNRIVGGQETEINEYPWMALLLYNDKFYCGGSLINNRYVITAAHCVNGFSAARISVRLFEHDTESTTETVAVERRVRKVIRHSGYSTSNYDNDIALLRLDRDVDVRGLKGATLRPVCLPERGKSFTGKTGVVTGWGATEEQGEISTRLQEVVVPIMSNTQCKKTPYGPRRITDNMLCAGYIEDSHKDSCQGDSGGPLHVITDSIHSVAGIVSWGEGCAKPNYPGVYTRVNRYVTWIENNTKDACYCRALKK